MDEKKQNKTISIKFKTAIIIVVIIAIIILAGAVAFIINRNNSNSIEANTTNTMTETTAKKELKNLPKPEITGGSRGELGIDKNINESTIDEYLNREDAVYRDMRMLEDPGNYEAIGGDRFLSGYVEGFEVVPLPYIIPVNGLPNEVGDTYTGTTLFYNDNGTYVANYKESMQIIEELFPKDKVIFLMCGGGGYSGMAKNFLVSLGWDENKIYNTGGYWYYKGEHNIKVKKEVNGKVSYDFDNVPYHKIEFDELTKSKNYKEPSIKVTDLKLSTSNIDLEEGTSFQLNVIVLPNSATNKEVKWTSGNKEVATVTEEGLVKAIGPGTATITVKSVDGEKAVTCEVIVNKKQVRDYIKLDELTKEANEFALYDLNKIQKEFDDLTDLKQDSNGNIIPNEYHDYNGQGWIVNDLWRKEYEKYETKTEEAKKRRLEIFNKLIDGKKTFIILHHTKECEEREYSVVDGAEKVLKQNNYLFFDVGNPVADGDSTMQNSKLDTSNWKGGSVTIIKDGKIYASVDPDEDSIKDEKELKNWLGKYIDIK